MFNPSRLELARKRRGLTKVALGRRAGLSPRALTDYASGRAEPSPGTIDEIAFATRFPSAFFHRPDVDEPTKDGASFRSLSTMTAGQRDAALAAGALAFELSAWIERRFELPSPKLPDLRDFKPAEAAMALRTYWGIGTRPIGNMVHLLESQGVRVYSLAERAKHVDAYSLWHRDLPFVFLNTMKTPEHSRMDAAHELGHLVMHRHGVPRGLDAEKDAQAFGSSFLMPEASVRAAMPRLITPSVAQLAHLKMHWRVSVAALAHRLYGLGLMTEYSYRGVFMQLSTYGRTREPNGIEREDSQVFSKVFGALRNSGTKRSDVAKDLDLYPEDIDSLVFGLSMTAVSEGRRVPDVTADERRRNFKVYG
jgi:Zn-dependent peptidase ImmA (M78 family)/transcriptional regulator with XRE-family HTH domain